MPMDSDVPAEWLVTKVELEAVERDNTPNWHAERERAARYPTLKLPFGFQHQAWLRLKEKMQLGDELWEFSSSGDSWAHLAGRRGIALVREGKVIGSIITLMN